MKKNIKVSLAIGILVPIIGLTSVLPTVSNAAQCLNRADQSLTLPPPGSTTCPAGSDPIAEISDFETIFANIVSVAGILLGFTFFIMTVIGGVRYLMSGGDPKALQAAKGTITWAIIGLALFALSFTILLLIQAFTGVNVTTFKIIN